MGVKVTKPKGVNPMLAQWRQWFDEDVEDVGDVIAEEATASEDSPTEDESLVNLNAVDDKGNRLYFQRDYVVQLRQEIKERDAKLKQLSQQNQESPKERQAPPAKTQKAASEDTSDDRYAQLEQRFNALLERIESQDRDMQMRQVAAAYKIPEELTPLLKGNTPEELNESAALLAQYVKKLPGRPAKSTELGATPSTAPNTRTDENRRGEYFNRFEEEPNVFKFDSKNLTFHSGE